MGRLRPEGRTFPSKAVYKRVRGGALGAEPPPPPRHIKLCWVTPSPQRGGGVLRNQQSNLLVWDMHWCWYIVLRIHLNQQLSYQLDYMLRVEHKIAFEVIFVMFVLQKINKDRYVDKSPVVCFMVLRDVPLFLDWRGRDGKLREKKKRLERLNILKKNCVQV